MHYSYFGGKEGKALADTATRRALRRATVWGFFAAAGVLFTDTALAEAGVPYCRPTTVVELFAGAPGCENASYLVLELEHGDVSNGQIQLYVSGPSDSQYIDVEDAIAPDAGGGTRVLIGTSAVADAFGVTPDVKVDQLPFTHDSGGVELCHVEFSYKANVGSHMCAGDALRLEEGRWENSIPAPQNAKGEQATRRDCPGASWGPGVVDAGTGDSVDAALAADAAVGDGSESADASPGPAAPGLCDPSVFEPSIPPVDDTSSEAPTTLASDSTAQGSVTDSTSGSSSIATGSSPSSSETSSPDVSSDSRATSDTTETNDAGLSPSDPSPAEGCSCRVGRSSTTAPGGVAAWALLAAGIVFRRRFAGPSPSFRKGCTRVR